MSLFFNYFGKKTKKGIINGQRILHFNVNENPKDDDYILISIDKNTIYEDILKDNKIKEIIINNWKQLMDFIFQ